jgi:hypothetical protein
MVAQDTLGKNAGGMLQIDNNSNEYMLWLTLDKIVYILYIYSGDDKY